MLFVYLDIVNEKTSHLTKYLATLNHSMESQDDGDTFFHEPDGFSCQVYYVNKKNWSSDQLLSYLAISTKTH